jgi:hypothetical protein
MLYFFENSVRKKCIWKYWAKQQSRIFPWPGAGLGASHQTGWTGVVAKLIEPYGMLDSKMILEGGKQSLFSQKDDNSNKQNETIKLSLAVSD